MLCFYLKLAEIVLGNCNFDGNPTKPVRSTSWLQSSVALIASGCPKKYALHMTVVEIESERDFRQ